MPSDKAARAIVTAVALVFLCLGLGYWDAGPSRAQSATLPPDDIKAIQQVISRQFDAFRRDDGTMAFSFASPTIRNIFGTAENFMRMVRRDYQPVYRPSQVDFRDLVQWRGQPTQQVLLVGPDQSVVMALYQMQRQDDGKWLINGCFLIPVDGKAT